MSHHNYSIIVAERDFAAEQAEAQASFENMEAAELAAAPAKQKTAELAGAAFERLLNLAETRDSGQIKKIVGFLAACFNSGAYRWDLSDLRVLDDTIRSDMLAVLQAQTGFAPYPYDLPGVSDGENRLGRVIDAWKPARWVVLPRD